jgi:AraC-like DNA-binding protein
MAPCWWPEQPRALEIASAEGLCDADRPDPAVAAIVTRLRAGTSVVATADAVGLSARQLHRRCLDSFGYGPKTLARVLRMERALALAGVSLIELLPNRAPLPT